MKGGTPSVVERRREPGQDRRVSLFDSGPPNECDCETCQSGGDCDAPHTHVYVGTDRGDECQICGRLADQFADLPDEMHPSFDGGGVVR